MSDDWAAQRGKNESALTYHLPGSPGTLPAVLAMAVRYPRGLTRDCEADAFAETGAHVLCCRHIEYDKFGSFCGCGFYCIQVELALFLVRLWGYRDSYKNSGQLRGNIMPALYS